MRRFLLVSAVLALALGSLACTGVHMGVGVRGGYYPWGYGYGRAPYYGPGWGDTIVVVPPDGGGGIDPGYPEAVPLPEPPPDMGMPDYGPMDMGGMDMGGGFDAGGFDF